MRKFVYTGNWVRVVDGNTVILNLDLGLHTAHIGPFQLNGVDAPPVSRTNSKGALLKEKLEGLLLLAGELRVETIKPDKYGRWLCEISYTDESGNEKSLNEQMKQD